MLRGATTSDLKIVASWILNGVDRRLAVHEIELTIFIVSPVAAGPAFLHNQKHRPIELEGRMVGYLDYTMPFATIYNTCGNPALVVPAGRSRNGLPIGIQIAAAHYAEAELIHFGKLIEELGVAFTRPAGY